MNGRHLEKATLGELVTQVVPGVVAMKDRINAASHEVEKRDLAAGWALFQGMNEGFRFSEADFERNLEILLKSGAKFSQPDVIRRLDQLIDQTRRSAREAT